MPFVGCAESIRIIIQIHFQTCESIKRGLPHLCKQLRIGNLIQIRNKDQIHASHPHRVESSIHCRPLKAFPDPRIRCFRNIVDHNVNEFVCPLGKPVSVLLKVQRFRVSGVGKRCFHENKPVHDGGPRPSIDTRACRVRCRTEMRRQVSSSVSVQTHKMKIPDKAAEGTVRDLVTLDPILGFERGLNRKT